MTNAVLAELPLGRRCGCGAPARSGTGPVVRRPALVQPLADPAGAAARRARRARRLRQDDAAPRMGARDPRPFAWVTADARDDEASGSATRWHAPSTPSARRRGHAVRRSSSTTRTRSGSRAGLDALAAIADDLPPLAAAGRGVAPAAPAADRADARPAARHRDRAARPRDDAAGGGQGPRRRRPPARPRHARPLLQRTEGWPVALALAALYLGDGGSRPNLARFGGADRLVADYVRDEVLGDLPDDALAFAVRTCVGRHADRPALRRARRIASDSASMLEALAGEGLVVPVDRTASATATTGWSATRCAPSSIGASRARARAAPPRKRMAPSANRRRRGRRPRARRRRRACRRRRGLAQRRRRRWPTAGPPSSSAG